jgi:sporulation integral membrane protein YlbJ
LKLLLIITLLAIFYLIYILFKKYDKNTILTFLCSILILYIVLNPKECISFTIAGAKLFFYAVFPSLFPFLVIVNLIISFGGIQIYSNLLGNLLCKPLGLPKQCSLVLLVSVFCGYPLGARYAAELYDQNLIDNKTFQRLLNIATNGSPLFIIGSVGTTMLGHPYLGYVLIISNILSCIIMGLLLPGRYKLKDSKISKKSYNPRNINIGVAMKIALEDAIKTCLSIGSFVMIFSVLINIIKSNAYFHTALIFISNYTFIPFEILQGLTLGIIEVTNGCNLIAISSLSYNYKLIITSFLIAFSGLSITSQVYSLVYKHGVSMKKYLSLKVVQGIISCLITLLICNIPFMHLTQETFVNNFEKVIPNVWFIAFIALIITLPVLINKLKMLIKPS